MALTSTGGTGVASGTFAWGTNTPLSGIVANSATYKDKLQLERN